MKKFLLMVSIVLAGAMGVGTLQASAETFKEFIAGLGKGTRNTFEGELTVTFRSSSKIYIQDGTAGMAMNTTNCELERGDKVRNIVISRSQYGGAVYTPYEYELLSRDNEVTPITCRINEMYKYPNMLVKVDKLEFENAGYTFGTNSMGNPLEQPVSQNGLDGTVVPFLSNIVNAMVPKSANVTGISTSSSYETCTLAPRDMADIEVLEDAEKKDDNTFAHFLKTLTYLSSATFEGELVVTYVGGDASLTICYQDDTAGAYYWAGSTTLKAGDKIKNVTIRKGTDVEFNNRYDISSYELVEENCQVTPKEIEYFDLYSGSPMTCMLVTLKNMNVQPNNSGVMGNSESYLIYPDGAVPNLAQFNTRFCPELAGMPLPERADITGINYYGYQICPLEVSQLDGTGKADVKITEVPDIYEMKALGNPELVRITGELEVIQTEINNEQVNGFFVIQDRTGGAQVRVSKILFPELEEGAIIKNLVLNCNYNYLGYTMPVLTRVDDKCCDVVSLNNKFEPRVIGVGEFNASTKVAYDYTLVKYENVSFDTEQTVFNLNEMYKVYSGAKNANILANYLPVDTPIPAEKCDVTGVAFYNTLISEYVVTPRNAGDILDRSGVQSGMTEKSYPVYNLMGVKVADSNNGDAFERLPEGVYIINGKKIMK